MAAPGVGDLVGVGTLAWTVYKACDGAPASFRAIAQEVAALQVIAREADKVLFARPLKPDRAEDVKTATIGCTSVLNDLQKLIDKYKSLGTEERRNRDRIGFANEDVAELRARLTSNLVMINVLISTSEIKVEQSLDRLVKDSDPNADARSILSAKTTGSLNPGEKVAWREIRKDLEHAGISLAAFNANRDFIIQWISDFVESNHIEEIASGRLGTHSEHPLKVAPQASIEVEKDGDKLFVPRSRHLRRFFKLYYTLSSPRKRILQAAERRQYDRMLWMLGDFRMKDRGLLDSLLCSVIYNDGDKALPTIENLLQRGANVNALQPLPLEMFPGPKDEYLLFHVAEREGQDEVLRLLLAHGAHVKCPRHSEEVGMYTTQRPLVILARWMSLSRLTILLEAGMDPNEKLYPLGAGYGWTTALHDIVTKGQNAKIDLLLKHGAEIDRIRELDGSTPLMFALRVADTRSVRHLITKGASVDADIVAKAGDVSTLVWRNPVEVAVYSQNAGCLRLLFDAGVRTGWLQALDEKSDILRRIPLEDRRYQPRKQDGRDEITDGYQVLYQNYRDVHLPRTR